MVNSTNRLIVTSFHVGDDDAAGLASALREAADFVERARIPLTALIAIIPTYGLEPAIRLTAVPAEHDG